MVSRGMGTAGTAGPACVGPSGVLLWGIAVASDKEMRFEVSSTFVKAQASG
jgi:hypothetical protein